MEENIVFYDKILLNNYFKKYADFLNIIQKIKKNEGKVKLFNDKGYDFIKFELDEEDCFVIKTFIDLYIYNIDKIWDFIDDCNTILICIKENETIETTLTDEERRFFE